MLKWVFKILKWRMEWIMVSQWKCQETAPRTTKITLHSSTTAKVSSRAVESDFKKFDYSIFRFYFM